MGISSQGNSNRRKNRRLMNEINVTPMVDVMLVLLVIFMITTPMLVAGIEVDLPKTESVPLSVQFKPLVISIDKNNVLYIAKTKIDSKELIAKLENITKEKKDTRIFCKRG
jgi:biopolymer transport protein TolR